MGDTGVLVATHLGRSLDVVGISTRPALVSGQELGTRLARPDDWRRNHLVTFPRFKRLDRVRTVHGSIARVDADERVVHVDPVDGPPVELRYDILVVATGVTNGFWRQDRVETMDQIEAGLASVAAQIAAAPTVAVVGGGPTGVSSAYNLARQHPDKAVHLFHSGAEPLPGYHPKARRAVVRELTEHGVHLHPGHRACVPDGFTGDRLTTEPIEWTTGQDPFAADLTLWATGQVTPNTGFLPADMLDEQGFVRVDEDLRVPGRPEVFAIGDVAATDPHRCSARNWGWRVVAHNVKALAGKGPTAELKRFKAPEHRWGSILGVQDDGMRIYQPNGTSFRIPKWAVQPLLFDLLTKVGIYGGVRRSVAR
jgi:NADH dehydrogenase FAD-containing subunit